MLQQALASRRVAIDRGRLAARDSAEPASARPLAEAPAGPPPVVVTLPYRAARDRCVRARCRTSRAVRFARPRWRCTGAGSG